MGGRGGEAVGSGRVDSAPELPFAPRKAAYESLLLLVPYDGEVMLDEEVDVAPEPELAGKEKRASAKRLLRKGQSGE